MAKKQIQSKDIIQDNVLKKTIAEFNAWGRVIDSLTKKVDKLAKATKEEIKIVDSKDVDAVKKLTKALDVINKSNEALLEAKKKQSEANKQIETERKAQEKQLKDLEKLQKKYAEGLSEEAIENEKLKVQIQEQNKQRKKLAKEQLGLIDKYAQESARLNNLRKQYKNLAIQNKANTVEGRKLLKNITELDEKLKEIDETVGQNQRNVGNYRQAVEKLNNTLNKVGVITVLVKAFELLSGAFGNTREGALALELTMNKVTATIGVTIQSIRASIPALITFYEAIKDGFNDFFDSIGRKVEQFELKLSNFGNIIKKFVNTESIFNPLANEEEFNKAVKNIDETNKRLKELQEEEKKAEEEGATFAEGTEQLTKAWGNFGSRVESNIKNLDTISRLTARYQAEIQALERSVSSLNKAQTLSLQIAENDKLNFKIRREASEQAVKDAIKLGDERERLARKELDLQNQIILAQLEVEKINVKRVDNAEKQAELIAKAIKQGENFLKVSNESEQAFTDAFVSYQDSLLEGGEVLADTLEKRSALISDEQELILDILLDGADNQKSINERIISSDKTVFSERAKLLKETEDIIAKSYEAQKDTVITANNAFIESEKTRIENSKVLTKAQKEQQLADLERQKQALTSAKIDEIASEKDATIQAEKIEALKLNEKFSLRLLEVIKDQRTATQDLTESNQDYVDSLEEKAKTEAEIEAQTKLLNKGAKADAEDFAEFEEELLQKEIDLAKERLRLAKERDELAGGVSQDTLNKQKELNDLLIDQQQKRIDKEQELEEENAESLKEIQESVLDALEDVLNKRYEKIQANLDRELEASKKQQDRLQELAERGDRDALESRQAEREKQQEIEKEKIEKEKELAKIELAIGIIKSYASNDGDLAKTIVDTTLLKTLITSSFPSFEKGTEDTGTNGKGIDGKGGFQAILHPNEGVITKEDNVRKLKAGLTNKQAIDYAIAYQHLKPKKEDIKSNNVSFDFTSLEKAIKDLPNNMPIQELYFDEQEKAYVHITKQNGKINRTHKRSNGLFR